MATFDGCALRARVVADYDALAHGVADAAEIGRIFETVMLTTISAVREAMRVSNAANTINRLPARLLVASFIYLPFPDRVRVSHVCFFWRTAALASPEMWSNISMSFTRPNRLELFKLALHRAGALPVDLEVNTMGVTNIEMVDAALEPYVQQLRRVSWSPQEQSAVWTRPAPQLERLGSFYGLAVNRDFLGGAAGRLQSLRIRCCAFPAICPALSTVVDLRIREMNLSPDPSSICRLFTLMPRLESLHLGGLERRFSEDLPPGPAPASLRELTLETSSSGYDLMRHYLAWDAHRFRAVSLAMGYVREPDLRPVLQDATLLRISCPGETTDTYLMSEHPGSIVRSIRLSSAFGTRWGFGKHVLTAHTGLRNVHTVALSHVALEEFVPVLARLRALKRLIVHVRSTRFVPDAPQDDDASEEDVPVPVDNTAPRFILDWAPLGYLPRIRGLESLTIQVCRMHHKEAPVSVEDAEVLLNVLASMDTHSLPHIAIEGFPNAPVYLHGLRLSFYTAAAVGPVVFRMPRPHMHGI